MERPEQLQQGVHFLFPRRRTKPSYSQTWKSPYLLSLFCLFTKHSLIRCDAFILLFFEWHRKLSDPPLAQASRQSRSVPVWLRNSQRHAEENLHFCHCWACCMFLSLPGCSPVGQGLCFFGSPAHSLSLTPCLAPTCPQEILNWIGFWGTHRKAAETVSLNGKPSMGLGLEG